MKVVLMHNRYQSVVPSGENAVVEREAEWLSASGVVVIPVVRDSDTIGQMTGMERALLPISPIYSVSTTRDLGSVLRRERPDILHLHNPYPLISPWVVRTAHRYDVPVVQTVHNYRHVCAAGTFFRDGHPCYDCMGRRVPYPAVQHACYRGSRLHSAVMAASITVHRSTWRAVQRYLVVTREMGTHLHSLGIEDDQIVVKPNAVEDPGPSPGPGSGFLFAGRLDEAKGTRLLAEAWKRLPDGALGSLTVAGDGPLRPVIEALAEQRSDVRFIGHQTAEGMKDAFRSASVVLAIPVWNEPFGLTVIEGLANSRPALVTDRGGPPELIGWGEPDPAGWVVPASVEGLSEGMRRALSEADTLRDTARRRYLQQFTPAAVTDTLLQTYETVAHEWQPVAHSAPSSRHQRPGRLGTAQRASWAAADQVLSSLINFVLAVAIARNVSTAEFGIFALAFALYLVCLTLSRAIATEPLLIRYSAADERTWRRGVAAATGTAIVFGTCAAIICVVAGIAVGSTAGPAFVTLGIVMIPLLLQDSWRYVFFSYGRGKSAFMNEVLRTIVMMLSLAVTLSLFPPSVPLLIVAWAGGAAAAAVAGIVQARVLPRPGRALSWWREHFDIAPRLTVEGAIISGAQYLTLFAVTTIAGLGVAGALRAGQLLMNALHIANYGLLLFGIPETVDLLKKSSSAAIAFCLRAGAGLVLMALLWGAALSFLPESIGVALLGETWSAAREVILPLAILAAAEGAQASAQVGLRAMARARESLRAMAVSSSLILGGGIAGAATGQDATTAAWGMAAGAVIGSIVWWIEPVRIAGKIQALDHPGGP